MFVFGSNESGRHGLGAAKVAATHFGAIYGKGVGMQGRSYAIPTKDGKLRRLDLSVIQVYVEEFKKFAAANPHLTFLVTKIGCGLAGYEVADIAPLFQDSPSNVVLPREFLGDPSVPD